MGRQRSRCRGDAAAPRPVKLAFVDLDYTVLVNPFWRGVFARFAQHVASHAPTRPAAHAPLACADARPRPRGHRLGPAYARVGVRLRSGVVRARRRVDPRRRSRTSHASATATSTTASTPRTSASPRSGSRSRTSSPVGYGAAPHAHVTRLADIANALAGVARTAPYRRGRSAQWSVPALPPIWSPRALRKCANLQADRDHAPRCGPS